MLHKHGGDCSDIPGIKKSSVPTKESDKTDFIAGNDRAVVSGPCCASQNAQCTTGLGSSRKGSW